MGKDTTMNNTKKMYETFSAQLLAARTEHGATQALENMVFEAVLTWVACLDKPAEGLEHKSMMQLAVGMTQVLAVRDVLIVSLIVRRDMWTTDDLKQFMVHAHDPQSVAAMERLLTQSFNSKQCSDPDRCNHGLELVRNMADAVPERFRTQPYALLAYLLWWQGNPEAYDCACQALALDRHCSLASILLSAMAMGVGPQWVTTPVRISKEQYRQATRRGKPE